MIEQKLFEETTNGFSGDYFFLSNMYPVDCFWKGLWFPSSEHLYQYLKIPPYADWYLDKIQHAEHGKVAKKIASSPKCPKKPMTNENRIKWMNIAVDAKFKDKELAQSLVDTYPVDLVEYNLWKDTFWGVYNGRGLNMLGRILMQKRKSLRRE